MSFLSFHGRIVIITGAGRGIGRGYAKEFARRGATVIVNDVDKHNDDGTSILPPAEQVANEICDSGGKAIPNFDSVENGERIIQKAIEEFGKVDVVISNAGLLQDRSFQKMSEHEWEAVHEVHLTGAFKLTKAVWPHFITRKFGRLIFVSSNSGIYGNFGQANYAAAKAGLIGFSKTLAIEGAKYNIHSNVIIPTAISRMTKNIFPEKFLENMKPEAVAPMVVYCAHGSCNETGKVYEAAGGWFGEVQFRRSKGKFIHQATAEDVRDHIQEIGDMTDSQHFGSMQEVMESLMKSVQQEEVNVGEHDREPMNAKTKNSK